MTAAPVDAATRFNPGDRVQVQGVIIGALDRGLRVNMVGIEHCPLLSELPVESVTLLDEPAAAPYTEWREDDELEVTVRVTVQGGGYGATRRTDASSHVYVGALALRDALAEGRVRLVKAAAPRYEPGRIYRDAEGDEYAYAPAGARDATHPFLSLLSGIWYPPAELADLVPCDLVPRETT